jgi:chemotaxis protein MotB
MDEKLTKQKGTNMKRMGIKGQTLALASLAAMLVFAGGCESKLKAENDALRVENLELRDRLTTEQAAREACDAERSNLLDKVATLESQTGQPVIGGGATTGFEGMGLDVERGAAGEITVRVPGDVLFASGKVDLKSTSKQTLANIARVLKSDYAGNRVRIEGYTDSDPIRKSKWKDNKELSAQRALAVERYLISQGVSDGMLYSAGFGEADPRASNSTSAGKAQNRRVEIVVVMN